MHKAFSVLMNTLKQQKRPTQVQDLQDTFELTLKEARRVIDGYLISDRGCHINWTLQVVSLGPPPMAPTESAPEGDPPTAADADPRT